jgi:diguanylate cyclase (GGDEF)-like protein
VDEAPMTLPRLEQVLRSIEGESWVVVNRDGTVLYGVGHALAGRGAREGTHIADFVHPDDLPRALDGISRVLSEPDVTFVDRVRLVLADGSHRVVDVTAVNRLDDPVVAGVVVRTVETSDVKPPALDEIIGSLAEAVPTPLLVADHNDYVLFSNSAARVLLGDSLAAVTEQLATARAEGSNRITFELDRQWIHARIAERSDGWIAMLDDVTAQKSNEDQLVRMATTDPLTGVANRSGFDARLGQLLAAYDDKPLTLIFVDLDGFKGVNDRHGHAAGDTVLKVVAARLQGEVRPTDVVGRLGGDEFGIICPGLPAETAPLIVERLVNAVRERITVGQTRIVVGATAGSATTPPAPSDPAGLLAAADAAMYREKSDVEVWQPVMEL